MEPIFVPCLYCTNFINDPRFNLCRAFPKAPGIPAEFMAAEELHRKPVPGQEGDFVYSPRPGTPFKEEDFEPAPDQRDLVGGRKGPEGRS